VIRQFLAHFAAERHRTLTSAEFIGDSRADIAGKLHKILNAPPLN
jgi:hypothetical protein